MSYTDSERLDLLVKIHDDLLLRAKLKAGFEGSDDVVIDMSNGIWSELKEHVKAIDYVRSESDE